MKSFRRRKMRRSDFYMTSGRGLTGASLENIGNSCFVNAVLQCLTHTVPLVEALRSSEHFSSCPSGDTEFCCLCALKQHVDFCIHVSGFTVIPKGFLYNLSKISPDFIQGQQQDAHEFLCCLLDKLHGCYIGKPSSFEENSPIKEIFGGRIRSQVCCSDCDHVTDTYEPLIDLSLEIYNPETCTLVDALESFTKVEMIDDPDNKFPCEGCKERVSVKKQIQLAEVPRVLMLNLKRFEVDSSGMYKIGKFVDYPLELDLRPFVSSPQVEVQYNYDLYAIVVHDGPPNDGHYYSIVHSTGNEWYLINDAKIFRFPEDMVLKRIAYMLFYIKKGSAPWFANILESTSPIHPKSEDVSEEEISEQKNDQFAAETESSESVKDVGESKSQAPEGHNMRLQENTEAKKPAATMEEETRNDEGSILSKKRGRDQCDGDTASPQSPKAVD